MSKYVSVAIFSEQNLINPEAEPCCVTTSHGLFWVALVNGTIKCFSSHPTEKKYLLIYEFTATWPNIQEIHYFHETKQLITLEKKDDEQKCRIYEIYWDKKRLYTRIPVFTFPMNQVTHVKVCTITNSILIASSDALHLFQYHQEGNHPICVLKLSTPYQLTFISIKKDFIAFGTQKDVFIFEIKTEVSKFHQDTLVSTSTSTFSLDEFFSNFTFDTSHGELLPNFNDQIEYQITGQDIFFSYPCFVNRKYISKCVPLLQKHFSTLQNISACHFFQHFEETRCVVTTDKKSYVYLIPKGVQIGEISYSGVCVTTTSNSQFYFVITQDLIEVWSVWGDPRGCLLRTYPFIGLTAISATNSLVTLLSKWKQKEVWSYNVYVLPIINLTEIYEDLMDNADSHLNSKQPNMDIYSKLIRECHGLLKSQQIVLFQQNSENTLDQLCNKIETGIYDRLVVKSYGTLAEIELKEKGPNAAKYFAASDKKLDQVINVLQDDDLLEYLDLVLFDKTPMVISDEKTANFVIATYISLSPQNLSKLLISNALVHYDAQIPASFLSNQIENGQVKNLDIFVSLLLLLRLGKVPEAIKTVPLIQDFVSVCETHPHLFDRDLAMTSQDLTLFEAFFSPKKSSFTSKPSLGLFLCNYFPWILMEVLYKLKICHVNFVKIFELKSQVLVQIYLSICLLMGKLLEHKHVLCTSLISDLEKNKKESNQDLISSYIPFISKCTFPNVLFNHGVEKWIEEAYPIPKKGFIEILSDPDLYASYQVYLLQSLVDQQVISWIEASQDFVGKNSIVFAHLSNNLFECFEIMLKRDISKVMNFLKHHCISISDWKIILEKSTQHIDLYKQEMLWISRNYTPEQLMTVLPMNGSIDFFLPYIESCFLAYKSREDFLVPISKK